MIAVYIRVSTDTQKTGLEAQQRALQEYLHGKEHVLFSDEGISGAKSSRPGLDSMMDAVRAGKFQTVLVYSFSRFARSTQHLLSAMEEFNRLEVSFVSLSENIDTATPMGRAVFTIIAALSELERELISERVKNGLKNARAKGKRIGRVKTRPSELIQALRQQGLSYRAIAKIAKVSPASVGEELKTKKEAA
jgi:DNA invertase Pin-like site-specific DNA recombinase